METSKKRNLPNSLAKIGSIVFHPIFTPIYGLLIIFTAPTFLGYLPFTVKRAIFLTVFANEVFLPLALMPFFLSRNIISSYNIEKKHERAIPLFTTAIFYSVTTYIIYRFQLPIFLKTFMLASNIILIAVTMINFWWKISIHGVGAGALTGTVVLLALKLYAPVAGYLIGTILISGIVLTSRLRLNNHNPVQVWGGYLTGLLGMILVVWML